MEQQSLLTDIEFNPVFASPGQRFLNYLIDLIIYYLLLVFVIIGLLFGTDSDSFSFNSSSSSSQDLTVRLVFVIFYILFYCLCEILFKGRTIGKFITGTKAVNRDGTEVTPKTILLRSLSRLVPFEQFSALGNPSHPWHDKWTNTFVIDVKQTALNSPSSLSI